MSVLKDALGTEFVNRIDSIVIFNRLREDDIKVIINNYVKLLREKLKEKDIVIRLGKKVLDAILENL